MHLLALSLCVLRNPIDCFRVLQADRKRFNYLPALVLVLLIVSVRVLFIYLTHYPLQDIKPQNADLLLESAFLIVPLIMWSAANFAVTSILDGETMMRESMMAALMSMVPYILLSIPLALLSHLMSRADAGLFDMIRGAVYLWCGGLFILSIRVMNSYSLLKSLFVVVANLTVMALMAAIALLMYALLNQLWMFLEGLVREFTYTLRRL